MRHHVLAAIAVALGTRAALGQTPTVYHACYVPLTGTVYRIREANTKPTCASTEHVPFSWTDGVNALRTSDAMGGDVEGTAKSLTVTGLLGLKLAPLYPQDREVLTFDAGLNLWRPQPNVAVISAHSQLSGLGADDHPQYLVTNGARASTNGFAVTGALGQGTLPVSGAGVRMLWYPKLAAFRAGEATSSEWDVGMIGDASVALGRGTRASGIASIAMGNRTVAGSDGAVALGDRAQATGGSSIAFGEATVASSIGSIAFGRQTTASGSGAVAIGAATTASGMFSTAMGWTTRASGKASTAMGHDTDASGDQAIALGNLATAAHNGSFVFGDMSVGLNGTAVRSPSPNSFTVRAAGGVGFYTNAALTSGVWLAPGAGAWSSLSDVTRKHAFRDVDGEMTLARIATMPIRSWSYTSQDSLVRHLGPTAQDFRAAFALGENETTINTVDIDGVNLLGVQTLERRTRLLREEIDALRAELRALRATRTP